MRYNTNTHALDMKAYYIKISRIEPAQSMHYDNKITSNGCIYAPPLSSSSFSAAVSQ